MVQLKHPHIDGLVRDEPSEVVGKWEKAGWLRVTPKTEPTKQDKQEANQTFGPSDEEVKQDERK